MDKETKDFLKNWGYPELIDHFEAEKVDYAALLVLASDPNSPDLIPLVPMAGTRLKFRKSLRQLADTSAAVYSLDSMMAPSDTTLDFLCSEVPNDQTKSSSLEIEVLDVRTLDSNVEEFVFTPQRSITGLPESMQTFDLKQATAVTAIEKENVEPSGGNINSVDYYERIKTLDLREFLSDSIKGRGVITAYDQNHDLNSALRKTLITVLLEKILSRSDAQGQPLPILPLKNEHHLTLARKIVELFPTECEEIYYIAPLSEGPQQKIAKGKIVDTYRNKVRWAQKTGVEVVGSSKKGAKRKIDELRPIPDVIEDPVERQSEAIKKDWLRHNSSSTWESIIENWNACRKLRKNELQKTTGTVGSIFLEWPILKAPKGYLLLEADYIAEFKNEISLYTAWPDFSTKIKALMHSDIKDQTYVNILKDVESSDCTPGSQDATLLYLLPVLCPTTARIPLTKGVWKPSTAESINGFILHVKIPGDLHIARENQRKKMQNMRLTLQPYVIVVGQRLSAIDACYVSIDETLYLLESPLKAVDICYKAFHVLQAKYPRESEQVWLLLQTYVYKMTTSLDKKIGPVASITKKLQKISKKKV